MESVFKTSYLKNITQGFVIFHPIYLKRMHSTHPSGLMTLALTGSEWISLIVHTQVIGKLFKLCKQIS